MKNNNKLVVGFTHHSRRLTFLDRLVPEDSGLLLFLYSDDGKFTLTSSRPAHEAEAKTLFTSIDDLITFIRPKQARGELTAVIEGNLGGVGDERMTPLVRELLEQLTPQRVTFFSGTTMCLRDCGRYCHSEDPEFRLPGSVEHFAVPADGARYVGLLRRLFKANKGWEARPSLRSLSMHRAAAAPVPGVGAPKEAEPEAPPVLEPAVEVRPSRSCCQRWCCYFSRSTPVIPGDYEPDADRSSRPG